MSAYPPIAHMMVVIAFGRDVPVTCRRSRSFHDLAARRWHAGESYWMLGWLGRRFLFRNQLCLLDPVSKFFTATFIRTRCRLLFALGAFGRTGKADVKMMLVIPPRSNFCEPTTIGTRLAAQSLLNRGVHKDAGDDVVLRRRSDHFSMRMGPHFGINIAPILRHHVLR